MGHLLLTFWRHYVKVGFESVMQSPALTGGLASFVGAVSVAAIPATEGQVAAYIAAVLCGVVVAALTAFVKYMTTTAVQGQEKIVKAVEANTRAMRSGFEQTRDNGNKVLIALGHKHLVVDDPVEIELEP